MIVESNLIKFHQLGVSKKSALCESTITITLFYVQLQRSYHRKQVIVVEIHKVNMEVYKKSVTKAVSQIKHFELGKKRLIENYEWKKAV